MEQTDKEIEKIDLISMILDVCKTLRQIWLWGLILILLFAAGITVYEKKSYSPVYETSASFTIKVVNPLYASASGYNSKTAEQMEKTFPYILSSNALQEKVKEYLGVSWIPGVTANTIDGTNVFTLTIQDSDPQRAYDVLNAVITCYPEVAEFVVGPTQMTLLDEPVLPTQPLNSFNLTKSLIKGVILGILIWMGLAFLLTMTQNTVRNENDLKKLLNFPCLGALPTTKVVGKDVSCPTVHHDRGRYGFSEAVHLLRLHLEKEMKAEKQKVLLISSALPGEGKTTAATNLAISLAQKGKKILLVDCDLRKPSIAKAFGMENKEGLTEFLEGKLAAESMIKTSKIANLHIIVGGNGQQDNPSEALSGEKLTRLLEENKEIYDYIILDTPPCGLLSDASELAELAECALMVVRQDYASKNQILDGVQFLTDSKLPVIGCVLNGIEGHGHGGYGYGYGYGYGCGYGYGSRYGSSYGKRESNHERDIKG